MKVFLFVTLISFSFSALPTLVGAVIPGGNVLSNITIRPLPIDSMLNLVEVANVSGHELTHVIQQRKSEISLIIENTKNLNLAFSNTLWSKLVLDLIKDGEKVDLSTLSNYILKEAFFSKAPELFRLAKEYGGAQNQVDLLSKRQEVLMDKLIKCEQNSRCMAPLKIEIVSTQKELDKQTLLRNNLFSELDTASQPESEGIQLLSNISKNRHESAMTSIRNIK